MYQKIRFISVLAINVVLAVACSNGSGENAVTGKGSIRAINAASDIGAIEFLIEEVPLGTLDFKEISGTAEYDDLLYNFNFDLFLPGDVESTRFLTHSLQVRTDQEYTFALAGSFADPDLFVWEQFGRDWATEIEDAAAADETISVLEVSYGHVSRSLGPVDIYLEVPGTSPAFATPRGTIAYGEFLAAAEIESGSYQLVLTEQGNPANILFASNPVALTAAGSTLVTILDGGGTTTAEISVRLMGQGVGNEIVDLDLDSEFRAVHAAFGTGDVDVYEGSDFSSPLVSDLSFGTSSGFHALEPGTTDVNLTPAGDVSVFLEQSQINLSPGSRSSMYFLGLPGDLAGIILPDDNRRLANAAKFRVLQGAIRFTATDVYFLAAGSDIGLVSPSLNSLLYAQNTGYLSVEPGEYELTFTLANSKTVIGGPFRLNLAGGGIYSVVAVDQADISTVDILRLDDFADN